MLMIRHTLLLLAALLGTAVACQPNNVNVTENPPTPPPTFTVAPTPTSGHAASLARRLDTMPPSPTPPATAVFAPTLPPSPSPTVVTATAVAETFTVEVIGHSVQGRPIEAYHFNDGQSRRLVFVGGIHGGYEWNTILLAYETIAYLRSYPAIVPANITISIIPSANPDGQHLIAGADGLFHAADVAVDTSAGRFNANNVDLNRNWDCEWSATAVWRNNPISGGSAPFSEPETRALRRFLTQGVQPEAVIFWHSAANGVFSSGCGDNAHAPSDALAAAYSAASGYPIYATFHHYPITGDAGNWLTTQGITAISVELENHEEIDWEQNRLGLHAVLDYYH